MTAQTPDTIVFEGQEWLLLATPLDSFLAAKGLGKRFVSPNTANWRGYLATWRVDPDGRLFVDAVSATVRGLGSGTQPVSGSAALGGTPLPLAADFVTGRLRLARGAKIRHVHSGFNSVWEEEILLEFERGRVASRQNLAESAAMGNAGPYQLHEPLLGGLSGGGFGQVIAAADLDGRPLVAKAPLPHGGGHRTQVWRETPAGRRPVHIPAQVFRGGLNDSFSIEVGPEVTAAVLRREAEILERDGGQLLPRSLGLWRHDLTGLDVLIMERLIGEPPGDAGDVVAVLEALALAVERGTFDAHGDIKREHVFIADGVVRICDPAPRFDDPALRGLTPLYNPWGESGPAADIAACATLLRHLPDAAERGHPGWRWCAAVLDDPATPPWFSSHRAALIELRRELDGPPDPPPPGWSVPPIPGSTFGLPAGPVPSVPVTFPPVPGQPAPGPAAPSWMVSSTVPTTAPTPPPSPREDGPDVGYSFAALALTLRASVIEPIDAPAGAFLPISEHAADAVDAILTALVPTFERYAALLGISPPEPPPMTLLVRRGTKGAAPGFVANIMSISPVDAAAPGPRAVDLDRAWNALAEFRLGDAFAHLADAARDVARARDPDYAAELIEIGQRIGGALTVLRGHLDTALDEMADDN